MESQEREAVELALGRGRGTVHSRDKKEELGKRPGEAGVDSLGVGRGQELRELILMCLS